MDREVRHLIIPVTKDPAGGYQCILSDDSIDREGEFMGKELIGSWAADDQSLPMLANHSNSMQSFIGGWTDRRLVDSADGHVGLAMKPNFFSKEANPLSAQIKMQIDEALKMGVNPGISIGFIPIEGEMTPQGFKHTKAEIVEASFVPVQSNRNAYAAAAKRFEMAHRVKKESGVIGAGADMEGKNAPDGKKDMLPAEVKAAIDAAKAELAAENKKLADRVEALEKGQAEKSEKDDEMRKAEEAKAAEAETKRLEAEGKIAKELEAYKKELETVKEAVSKPKSRIPAGLIDTGAGKDAVKDEGFNATKAFLNRMAEKG